MPSHAQAVPSDSIKQISQLSVSVSLMLKYLCQTVLKQALQLTVSVSLMLKSLCQTILKHALLMSIIVSLMFMHHYQTILTQISQLSISVIHCLLLLYSRTTGLLSVPCVSPSKK
jgi:hypothetical protein